MLGSSFGLEVPGKTISEMLKGSVNWVSLGISGAFQAAKVAGVKVGGRNRLMHISSTL